MITMSKHYYGHHKHGGHHHEHHCHCSPNSEQLVRENEQLMILVSKAGDEIEALHRIICEQKEQLAEKDERINHFIEKYEGDCYDLEKEEQTQLFENGITNCMRNIYISEPDDNGKVVTVVEFTDGTKTKSVYVPTDGGSYSELFGIMLCIMKRQNHTHVNDKGYICSKDVWDCIDWLDKELEYNELSMVSLITRTGKSEKSGKKKIVSRSDYNGKPEEWAKLKEKVLDYKRDNLDKTTTEVASAFSMAVSTVSKWFKEAGLRDDVRNASDTDNTFEPEKAEEDTNMEKGVETDESNVD